MQTPKRILKEIADLADEGTGALGIFYAPNEIDVRKGSGLVVGPEGTPYAHCPLVFSVELPMSYPADPPKVLIRSSDGTTRFHPNLYTGGKVCLSILGTWSGPAWSAVMTIRTVFTSILGILDDNPIVNEPGYERLKGTPTSANYTEAVQFRLAAYILGQHLDWRAGRRVGHLWEPFADVVEAHGDKWLQGLWSVIKAKCAAGGGSTKYSGLPYGMEVVVDWGALQAKGLAASLDG